LHSFHRPNYHKKVFSSTKSWAGLYFCRIGRNDVRVCNILFFTEFSAEITDTELAVWVNEGIALRNDIYEIHHNRVVNPLGWEGTIREKY